ncbi:hypothetical protein GGS20DRAFT_537364 [Poronia punctata]|nr:hypothetical protein GGS20DRAFT_537364 [Poronia punctata]
MSRAIISRVNPFFAAAALRVLVVTVSTRSHVNASLGIGHIPTKQFTGSVITCAWRCLSNNRRSTVWAPFRLSVIKRRGGKRVSAD